MAQQQQQNILATLIQSHNDTIDAQKQLMAYMRKHISELEKVCAQSNKVAEEYKALSLRQQETIDRMTKDNMESDQLDDMIEAAEETDL